MKPSDYLDKVRDAIGAPSDYALQKPLSLSKQRLSNYRKNKDFFSDEVSLKVAEILRIHAGIVILDMHRERAKTPETQAVWSGLMDKLSASFNSLLPCPRPRGTLRST